MGKTLFILTLLLIGAGISSAQGVQNEIKVHRPNISGTWVLSSLNGEVSESDKELLMVIKQMPDSVIVELRTIEARDKKEEVFAITIYTDGRESEIPGFLGGSTSITGQWRDGKLFVSNVDSPKEGPIEVELSADGNRLICRSGTAVEKRNGVYVPSEIILERYKPAATVLQKPIAEAPRSNSKVLLQDIKITSHPN